MERYLIIALALWVTCAASAQARRKVIINEDASGPGGSNMQAILLLVQSPQVEVLGITVCSGDQWRDEEVEHTLRLLEIVGRTDIPVMSGAAFPLLRTRAETKLWEERYGKVAYEGAWDDRWWHEPFAVPALAEGKPKTRVSEENAVNFLIRTVRKYPHEVSIYEGAPMTNLALAISLEPNFPALAKELIFMGGGLNPDTDYPEFADNPRHEFNFWFDPEAAEIVLRAPWKRIVCTPTDVSIKTRLSPELVKQMASTNTAAGQYIQKYFQPADGGDIMWDELAAAAWIDPSLITKKQMRYMSVDVDHGPGYGDTLINASKATAQLDSQPVEVQLDVNTQRFYEMFAKAMQSHPGS